MERGGKKDVDKNVTLNNSHNDYTSGENERSIQKWILAGLS